MGCQCLRIIKHSLYKRCLRELQLANYLAPLKLLLMMTLLIAVRSVMSCASACVRLCVCVVCVCVCSVCVCVCVM